MSSPASFKNHPFHPILVALPIGLWAFSLICDIIFLAGATRVWADTAYLTMIGGILGALGAAIPGFIDYLSITDGHTKVIAIKHMIANLTIVGIFVVNFVVRTLSPDVHVFPFILSLVGIGALLYSGWLGGSLVYEHGMAVDLDDHAQLKNGRMKPYRDKRIPSRVTPRSIAQERR